MKSIYELKTRSRLSLKGNWAQPVLTQLIQTILPSTCLISIFVLNPIAVGANNAYRKLLHGDVEVFGNTFNSAISGDYTHRVLVMFLMEIYIFLWTLLLIVPGIVKYYSYAMVPYLLEDEPDLDADSCIHRSRELMEGHKLELFYLDLSFIGWFFLCILTAGIGFFWLGPYIKTAHAAFYEELVGYSGSFDTPDEQ